MGLSRATNEEAWADPGVQECVSIVERAAGIEVLPSDDVPDGETDWQTDIVTPCIYVSLFEQVASAAGPDLTNDSFRTAIDAGLEFSLPVLGAANLEAGRYDAVNLIRLGVFDSTIGLKGGLAPMGDMTPID